MLFITHISSGMKLSTALHFWIPLDEEIRKSLLHVCWKFLLSITALHYTGSMDFGQPLSIETSDSQDVASFFAEENDLLGTSKPSFTTPALGVLFNVAIRFLISHFGKFSTQ